MIKPQNLGRLADNKAKQKLNNAYMKAMLGANYPS